VCHSEASEPRRDGSVLLDFCGFDSLRSVQHGACRDLHSVRREVYRYQVQNAQGKREKLDERKNILNVYPMISKAILFHTYHGNLYHIIRDYEAQAANERVCMACSNPNQVTIHTCFDDYKLEYKPSGYEDNIVDRLSRSSGRLLVFNI
jgi:hypothetical protein